MARKRPSRRSSFTLRFRGLRTATVVVAVVLVWLAFNTNSLMNFAKAYHARNTAQDRVEKLRNEVAALESQKRALKMKTFESEKSVRESYHLVKPGEKLILLRAQEEDLSQKHSNK